jgi:DNA polymerase (family 10)
VERRDRRGDLHVRTRDSDGRDDIEALVAAARAAGLAYRTVTDHSSGAIALASRYISPRVAGVLERVPRYK